LARDGSDFQVFRGWFFASFRHRYCNGAALAQICPEKTSVEHRTLIPSKIQKQQTTYCRSMEKTPPLKIIEVRNEGKCTIPTPRSHVRKKKRRMKKYARRKGRNVKSIVSNELHGLPQ